MEDEDDMGPGGGAMETTVLVPNLQTVTAQYPPAGLHASPAPTASDAATHHQPLLVEEAELVRRRDGLLLTPAFGMHLPVVYRRRAYNLTHRLMLMSRCQPAPNAHVNNARCVANSPGYFFALSTSTGWPTTPTLDAIPLWTVFNML